MGWHRVLQASRNHRVCVLHSGRSSSGELARLARQQAPEARIEFVDVPNLRPGNQRDAAEFFWSRYRRWHREAYSVAKQLHAKHSFDFVHQVNFCSFREPGDTWRLDIPFIWGPIGGTQNFPLRFLTECDLWGGCREALRNLKNSAQLRTSRRVRKAARAASVVYAATRLAQTDLKRCLGVDAELMLETGISQITKETRTPPETTRPFRLVWAGRQRTWKGLPLLLKALAQLGGKVNHELRILGVGASEPRWRKLADRLGLAERTRWLGWPTYEETLAEYAHADAFVFTSLRDTSGTGLLESLAAGTPVIGLNHQGAADILTPECSIQVPVRSPRQVSSDLAIAIERLSGDAQLWKSLSFGGKDRAKYFLWERLAGKMEDTYQQVLSVHRHPRRGTSPARESVTPVMVPDSNIASASAASS